MKTGQETVFSQSESLDHETLLTIERTGWGKSKFKIVSLTTPNIHETDYIYRSTQDAIDAARDWWDNTGEALFYGDDHDT